MTHDRMKQLIDEHIAAEIAGDTGRAVSMYTDDVQHDVIGSPLGVLEGPQAAQGFYDHLVANIDNERMTVTRQQFGDDFCVIEHECQGVVNGEFLGVAGNGRRITFRMLHVWDFKDDRISREQVWLDGASITGQLMAPA